jgi:hypothetical protein
VGNTPESAAPQVEDGADDSLASLLSRGVLLHRELQVSPSSSSDMVLSSQFHNPVAASSTSFLVDILQEALDLIGEDDLDVDSSPEYFCSGADTRDGSSLPQ